MSNLYKLAMAIVCALTISLTGSVTPALAKHHRIRIKFSNHTSIVFKFKAKYYVTKYGITRTKWKEYSINPGSYKHTSYVSDHFLKENPMLKKLKCNRGYNLGGKMSCEDKGWEFSTPFAKNKMMYVDFWERSHCNSNTIYYANRNYCFTWREVTR